MVEKKSIFLCFLLLIFLLLRYYINDLVFNLLGFLIIFLITFLYFSSNKTRHKYRYEKKQDFVILLLFYFLIYFLSGLIFGYEYTPYNKSFSLIIKNTLLLLVPIIFQEYIRYKLLATTKRNTLFFLCYTLIFVAFSLPVSLFTTTFTNAGIFEYICGLVIPSISVHLLCSYLCLSVGYDVSIYYRLFFTAIPIYLPIIPSHPWIITGIVGVCFPALMYKTISSCDAKRDRVFSRRKIARDNFDFFTSFLFFAIFAGFIVGFFRYQPIAVLSNSMQPVFSKGSVVVMDKLKDNDYDDLEVYDIIYFKVDNIFVIHRIIDIVEDNGNVYYYTKGDNNTVEDPWVVSRKDIYGKILFSIPLVGYPSVWLNEFLMS